MFLAKIAPRMPTGLFPFLLAALLCLAGAQASFALNEDKSLERAASCSAQCGDSTIECSGRTCSAQDDVGCTWTDENDETHSEKCPFMASESFQGVKKAVFSPSGAKGAVQAGQGAVQAQAQPARIPGFALASWADPFPKQEIREAGAGTSSAAVCVASCPNGGAVTCVASGQDSCFALDGCCCQIYHANAGFTHNSCSTGISSGGNEQ